jgi:hypothetical protein
LEGRSNAKETKMKNVRFNTILFWTALFFFWYTWRTEGYEKEIELQITPKVQIAPLGKRGTVRASWKIQPNEANVYYSFAYSGAEEGSTLRSMNEYSEIHYERFIELPPGQYLFVACVIRNERPKSKTYCAKDTAEVR